MARNGAGSQSPARPFFGGVAGSASAPTLWRDACVFFGIWVPILAMRFCFLAFPIGLSAKFQAANISLADWANHGFVRQTAGRSMDDRICFQAAEFRKLNRQIRASFYSQAPIHAPIPLLFFLGGPATIFWSVISIVVLAINRSSVRTFSHIFSKSQKRVAPSITDAYPSASIVLKRSIGWRVAATKHALPNAVYRMFIDSCHARIVRAQSR